MARIASPIECAPVEQADTCEKFGPLAPKRIDTRPGAMLTMIMGTKYGEMPRRGPFSSRAACVFSIVDTPPRPAPR